MPGRIQVPIRGAIACSVSQPKLGGWQVVQWYIRVVYLYMALTCMYEIILDQRRQLEAIFLAALVNILGKFWVCEGLVRAVALEKVTLSVIASMSGSRCL